MKLDKLKFIIAELARFLQNLVRNPYLAHIVKHCRRPEEVAEVFYLSIVDIFVSCPLLVDFCGNGTDALNMGGSFTRIAQLRHPDHSEDQLPVPLTPLNSCCSIPGKAGNIGLYCIGKRNGSVVFIQGIDQFHDADKGVAKCLQRQGENGFCPVAGFPVKKGVERKGYVRGKVIRIFDKDFFPGGCAVSDDGTLVNGDCVIPVVGGYDIVFQRKRADLDIVECQSGLGSKKNGPGISIGQFPCLVQDGIQY